MKKQEMLKIEAAVVQISQSKSRGVLIPGNMILTAAHCVSMNLDAVNLNDGPIEHIITAKGEQLTVEAIAVEPVNDIAVLGSLDEQERSEEAGAFEAFCRSTKAVKICLARFEAFESFPVHILNANGKWIWAKAKKCHEDAQVFIVEPDENIEAGASGGPIVTEDGELVGIVTKLSHSIVSGVTKSAWGWTPYPPLTLPLWVTKRVFGGNLARWTQNLKSRHNVKA